MRQIAVIALLCLGPHFLTLSTPAWAEGPSFDCAKASTPVEKAICASGDLSALDKQIADEYPAALSIGQAKVAEQRAWLVQRDKACAPDYATECLRRVLMGRHAFLTSKPDGYRLPTFRGHPGFDCDKAETENEKAICSYQELSELYAALMKAYDAAEQEGFKLIEPETRSNWRKEACKQNESDDLTFVIGCLKTYMRAALEDSAQRATYEERVPSKWSAYSGAVKYKYGLTYDVLTVAGAPEMTPHIDAINANAEFKKTNGQVAGCTAMAAVGHERNNQPEGYRDFAYGGLCTINRGGKPQRELVCIETYGPPVHEMAVGDRPIGQREIAIFTAINCD